MTRGDADTRSPIRQAKADALAQAIAGPSWAFWRRPRTTPPPEVHGELGLTATTYEDLRELGLTRAEVHAAVDALVGEGRATATAEHGIVILRLRRPA